MVVCEEMDEIEIAAVWYLNRRSKKRKQKREFWVHPIVQLRLKEGTFHMLFHHLVQFPSKFFNYFRMSVQSFNELLNAIKTSIERQDTTMRMSISPKERLAVSLR